MCLNCGCGIWEDDMGKPDNLTLTKVAKAAMAEGMHGSDTLTNLKNACSNITPEEIDKKIAQIKMV